MACLTPKNQHAIQYSYYVSFTSHNYQGRVRLHHFIAHSTSSAGETCHSFTISSLISGIVRALVRLYTAPSWVAPVLALSLFAHDTLHLVRWPSRDIWACHPTSLGLQRQTFGCVSRDSVRHAVARSRDLCDLRPPVSIGCHCGVRAVITHSVALHGTLFREKTRSLSNWRHLNI